MPSLLIGCAQFVENTRRACGQNLAVLHTLRFAQILKGITIEFSIHVYTICVQKFCNVVCNFTPVSGQFYTLFTGPTKTTTN